MPRLSLNTLRAGGMDALHEQNSCLGARIVTPAPRRTAKSHLAYSVVAPDDEGQLLHVLDAMRQPYRQLALQVVASCDRTSAPCTV
jgi:hypothetical protein